LGVWGFLDTEVHKLCRNVQNALKADRYRVKRRFKGMKEAILAFSI
jgi:hypothetical protein